MNPHKKPKTMADLEHLRIIARRQLDQIMAENTWVNCGACSSAFPLWKLFRCYYCGIWICENCAPEHFGGKRKSLGYQCLPLLKRIYYWIYRTIRRNEFIE